MGKISSAPAATSCTAGTEFASQQSGYSKRMTAALIRDFTLQYSLPWLNVVDYGALANGTTDDTAAIQALVDLCPDYGTVLFPSMCLVTATILVSKPINIMGVGSGSGFLVGASVGATTDVLRLGKDTGPILISEFCSLSNFAIKPVSGTPGRHAIVLDGDNAFFQNLFIDRVEIKNRLGGRAIYAFGSSSSQGCPTLTTIQQCFLSGGATMLNAGDSIRIVRNVINGPGIGLDIDAFQAGATMCLIEGNSFTAQNGDVRIGAKAMSVSIFRNQFETPGGSWIGDANTAMVKIDGTIGDPAMHTKIEGNTFAVPYSNAGHSIGVDHASYTVIRDNAFLARGVASKDIIITANALGTLIGPNHWLTGTPITDMISDASASTRLDTDLSGLDPTLNAWYVGSLTTNPGLLKIANNAGLGYAPALAATTISGGNVGLSLRTVTSGNGIPIDRVVIDGVAGVVKVVGSLGVGTAEPTMVAYGDGGIAHIGVKSPVSTVPSVQIGIGGTASSTTDVMGDVNFLGMNATAGIVSRAIIRAGLSGAVNTNFISLWTMVAGVLAERMWVTSAGCAVAGAVRPIETAYAALPASPVVGMICNISDCNTVTWGDTAAASGSYHVSVRYNGTNWTVVGK